MTLDLQPFSHRRLILTPAKLLTDGMLIIANVLLIASVLLTAAKFFTPAKPRTHDVHVSDFR